MYEKPDPSLFLNHHSLKCAGTNTFCLNTLDDLELGAWVAAGEQNSSVLLSCGAGPVELPSRGSSEPRTPCPTGIHRNLHSGMEIESEWHPGDPVCQLAAQPDHGAGSSQLVCSCQGCSTVFTWRWRHSAPTHTVCHDKLMPFWSPYPRVAALCMMYFQDQAFKHFSS